MRSEHALPEVYSLHRLAAFHAPIGAPLLIAFECSLQSMILFEGLFLATFLLTAALILRPFLVARLHWPEDCLRAWSRASVFGTITATLVTLLYALEIHASSPPPGASRASTAEYLTVAIGFPLILGGFQAFAVSRQIGWPFAWPLVPTIGCLLSYAASQVIEMLEAFDKSGLITIALTMIVAFFITYWTQRAALMLLRPKPEGTSTA
jgi:hypothetical protein